MYDTNRQWWYKINNSNITIDLDKLNTNILDKINIIPKKYNNLKWCITGENVNLNMDKLMDKLLYCSRLEIKSFNINLSILPPNLITLSLKHNNKNILEFPKTLKKYKSFDIYHTIHIPDNLPENLEEIDVTGAILNKTFYNIPYGVKKCKIDTINVSNDIFNDNLIWPLNLEELKLTIHVNSNINIGILPYGIKTVILDLFSYNFPILLPPTVTRFYFESIRGYKYSECLNNLPDNIIHLTLLYDNIPKLLNLPLNCKTFYYLTCHKDIIHNMRLKYPNVSIY